MENKKWQKTTGENNNKKKNYGGHMKKLGMAVLKHKGCVIYFWIDKNAQTTTKTENIS